MNTYRRILNSRILKRENQTFVLGDKIIKPEKRKIFPWRLVVIFFLFSMAIILTGMYNYKSQKTRLFAEQENELSAISKLKIDQIEQWHSERMADATVIKANIPLIRSIKKYFYNNDSQSRNDLSTWMRSVCNMYDYSNVLLIDTLLQVRLTVLQSDEVAGDTIEKKLNDGLNTHNIIMTDIHRSENVPGIHLDIIVPLVDSVSGDQRPVGFVIIRVDPGKILFPLVQSWPTLSKSSETLLIRREGDSVLFLNELRHKKNTALNFRIALENKSLPAVKVVEGGLGLVEGLDYRNVPVIAWLADVPSFPWKMVAKVDKEEIQAPLRRYVFYIVIITILLILINAFIFGFWIWQQRIKFYRSQLKNEVSLRESEMKFRQTFDLSPIGIVMVGLDKKFIRCNDSFSKSLGFKMNELEGKTITEVTHPEDINIGMDEMIAIAKGVLETSHVQKRYLRKDGLIVWGDVLISLIRNKSGEPQYFLAIIQDITESKKIVEALRESEERFRSLYENVTIGIYRTTVDGKILMANPALVSMLGFDSFEQLTNRNLEHEGYEPDYPRSKFLETIEKEGKVIGLESAWRRKNGDVLFVRESAKAVKDALGKMLYYDGTVEDITVRKKVEEALVESEDKFKYIFDHSLIAKSITLPSGEISVNRAFCDMLGYQPDELKKIKWADISHPDDIEQTNDSLNLILSGKSDSARFIKRYIHKNGTIVWADVGTSLRRDANNNPQYFMTSANDITERKAAEDELRVQSEIMSHMAEAVYLVRMADGIIVYTNPRFEELFGYEPGEMILKHVSIVNAPTVKSPDQTAVEIINDLDKNGYWVGEVLNIKKDGTVFWSHANVAIFDHSKFGKVLVSVQQDITERKNAEYQIKKLNEELEHRVIQRTELLEAANKELEAFSYSVSHDLRAPLRSVHGFTKILLEDYESKLDDEGKRICEIISSSATQMGELIDDLLSFSRIGRSSLNPSEIDMKKMAQAVFEGMTSPVERNRIKLNIGKLQKAVGDTTLIGLVWTNLISNALKYSSKNDVSEINIGSESDGKMITYSINDNGVGFDMQYAHKLFGVFQRLHSEADFEGNGVGLAIVQRIILKHGGKVWAEGEVGKGATFFFSLPVSDINKKTHDTRHTIHG